MVFAKDLNHWELTSRVQLAKTGNQRSKFMAISCISGHSLVTRRVEGNNGSLVQQSEENISHEVPSFVNSVGNLQKWARPFSINLLWLVPPTPIFQNLFPLLFSTVMCCQSVRVAVESLGVPHERVLRHVLRIHEQCRTSRSVFRATPFHLCCSLFHSLALLLRVLVVVLDNV